MTRSGCWGAVLAGGRSSRMGRDKRRVLVGDVPLLDLVVSRMERLFDRVLILGDPDDPVLGRGWEVRADSVEGVGPLGGILTALRWCEKGQVFITACDMPRFDPALVSRIRDHEGDEPVVLPVASGRWHPLHARYAGRIAPEVEDAIAAGRLGVNALVRSFGPHLVEAPPEALFNLNTPGDLDEIDSLIS